VQCTLETGRTHQIRVHLAAIGHPLVGDPAYGGRGRASAPACHRQALHAIRVAFIHTHTKGQRQWETPLPDDMEYLLSQLRTSKQR
jgi:23S rRNA pseudouridine1911/1915/1917 synthase